MQFCMISVSFFHIFIAGIIEENAPGGGVLARFYRPGVGVLNSFLPGGGEFAHQKICPGFCPGGDGQTWN